MSASLPKVVIILAALAVAACAQRSGEMTQTASVTGTVTYLQRIALAPDAIVMVILEDVSLANAPAQPIGRQDIATNGRQVPIPFEIRYDPETIDPRHVYAVSAQIMQGERLLFVNDAPYRVITQGNPHSAEILVRPAS